MPDVTYKLPKPFLDAAADVLNLIDWATVTAPVTVTLPNDVTVKLELVRARGMLVRAASPGDAMRIRRFSDEIAAAQPDRYPKPDPAEVERVIKMRNPATEQQD